MPVSIGWKTGFEIELVAPRGLSRRDLAEHVAARTGGRATRFFHPESEISKVPGQPVFENLTLGFRVTDSDGNWVASFVDDLTLRADCRREAAPKAGWYRIVGDDPRLLRLAARHCDAALPLEEVLRPFAALFGQEVQFADGGMVRVSDEKNASLAIGAPLPGERERPCEIVTAPIERDHHAALEALLADARQFGFTIPREGATHIHFDAAPLQSAGFIARFVRLGRDHREGLRKLVGVNPHCVRLGDWPPELDEIVFAESFANLDWEEAKLALRGAKLAKYCDFNLKNMIDGTPDKCTLEIRILPSLLETDEILQAAALFEAMLRLALDEAQPLPADFGEFLRKLPLTADCRAHWDRKATNL